MQEMAASNLAVAENLSAYGSSWEHLSDELRRLDLLIRLQLMAASDRQPASPLDQFRGIVVTEGEIARLLDDAARAGSPNAKGQMLIAAITKLNSVIEARKSASLEEGIQLSLPHLGELFQLSAFEQQCLLICLAPELDRKYEKLYAYLQDDVTRKKPTVSLVFDPLLEEIEQRLNARAAFDPQAPLLKYYLLQISDDSSVPLVSRSLKLDDRIVNYLLGSEQIDPRLEQIARFSNSEDDSRPVLPDESAQRRALSFMRSHFEAAGSSNEPLTFYIYGPYGAGKRSLAETIADEVGLDLIIGDVERILTGPLAFEEALRLIGREALLFYRWLVQLRRIRGQHSRDQGYDTETCRYASVSACSDRMAS